jgi:hypothetical protein
MIRNARKQNRQQQQEESQRNTQTMTEDDDGDHGDENDDDVDPLSRTQESTVMHRTRAPVNSSAQAATHNEFNTQSQGSVDIPLDLENIDDDDDDDDNNDDIRHSDNDPSERVPMITAELVNEPIYYATQVMAVQNDYRPERCCEPPTNRTPATTLGATNTTTTTNTARAPLEISHVCYDEEGEPSGTSSGVENEAVCSKKPHRTKVFFGGSPTAMSVTWTCDICGVTSPQQEP